MIKHVVFALQDFTIYVRLKTKSQAVAAGWKGEDSGRQRPCSRLGTQIPTGNLLAQWISYLLLFFTNCTFI